MERKERRERRERSLFSSLWSVTIESSAHHIWKVGSVSVDV